MTFICDFHQVTFPSGYDSNGQCRTTFVAREHDCFRIRLSILCGASDTPVARMNPAGSMDNCLSITPPNSSHDSANIYEESRIVTACDRIQHHTVASLVWRFADDMGQMIESDELLTVGVDVAESGVFRPPAC
jgi:hypothetical protein